MVAALLLAKLPEAYSIFDPLVDVLPIIPVFFCCWRLFGRLLSVSDKTLYKIYFERADDRSSAFLFLMLEAEEIEVRG